MKVARRKGENGGTRFASKNSETCFAPHFSPYFRQQRNLGNVISVGAPKKTFLYRMRSENEGDIGRTRFAKQKFKHVLFHISAQFWRGGNLENAFFSEGISKMTPLHGMWLKMEGVLGTTHFSPNFGCEGIGGMFFCRRS